MRRVLDGRSLAVGLFAGAALVAGLGAAQNAVRDAEVGRFQVSAGHGTAYVVDTATGRVWANHEREFFKPKVDAAE